MADGKPKKNFLKSVQGEDDTTTKALLLGLNELREQILKGEVVGVAFAVEYLEGGHGNHYFTATEDPRNLHFAVSELQMRILREAVD